MFSPWHHSYVNGAQSFRVVSVSLTSALIQCVFIEVCADVTNWEWGWAGAASLTCADVDVGLAAGAAPDDQWRGKKKKRPSVILDRHSCWTNSEWKNLKSKVFGLLAIPACLLTFKLCSLMNIPLQTRRNSSQRKFPLVEKYWVWADPGGCEGHPLFCLKKRTPAEKSACVSVRGGWGVRFLRIWSWEGDAIQPPPLARVADELFVGRNGKF